MITSRHFAITVAIAAALSAGGVLAQENCEWQPERAVTYIVPWGAGGGTDANSRRLASMLEERWGVPINVVNRTGGNGVVGHSAIATARPDGYTIGSATVEITTMHWIGLTDITHEDLTPLALIDAVAAGIVVDDTSQFQSLEDLLAYAEENPGELTASGTAIGGIWHLALAGMLNAEGMNPNAIRWIPSEGAAAALQELLAGGVDVATPSLSEARGLIESGDVRALGVMSDSAPNFAPNVPLTSEVLDSGWTLSAFITTSGPAGMPDNIACSYAQAIQDILATDEWAEFKQSRGAEVVSMPRDELQNFLVESDAALGETVQSAGLAR